MKKYLLIAVAALAAVAFVSCNKDNEVKKDKEDTDSGAFVTKDATNVCINEVNGGDGYKGIELYNPTGAEVSLNGWKIVKNDEEKLYWEGTSENKIASKGYFVIKANKSTGEIDAVANATGTGGLSGKKIVKLELKDASNTSLDVFDRGWTKHWDGATELGLPDAGTNSFARQEDGKKTWKVMAPTFGATNKGANVIGEVTVDPE